MDRQNPPSIAPRSLYSRLGTAAAPTVVDVRRAPAFDADNVMIVGAIRRPPEDADRWSRELPSGRPVIAYCMHGGEVSQGVASALRVAGIDASYLDGGIGG